MKKIGLLGYDYTASYFAQLLVREGYEVWGTSRDRTSLMKRQLAIQKQREQEAGCRQKRHGYHYAMLRDYPL